MAQKIKIAIVGIGGVGGYFGALLAKKYSGGDEVEIIFIARGEHLNQINKNGLKVISGDKEFVVEPDLATDDFNKIGVADYILICTKSYDLQKTIAQLKPCINTETILLPFLNGVNANDKILEILPNANLLNGCAFIVSSIKSAGVIENMGSVQKLSFGTDGPLTAPVLKLKDLMIDAEIDVLVSDKISTVVWEKFIFISPIATLTSSFNSSIGKVLEENIETVLSLIEEVKQLAIAKGIVVSDGISGKTLSTMKSMKYDVTSSMHRDYINKKPVTEVESLTGYVVREAAKLGVETPNYRLLYNKLVKTD